MNAILYYSISSNLTKDEINEIDRRVTKDRKTIYLFFRELASNSKRKAKRLCLYVNFVFVISQPLAPYAYAVMVTLPPPIERLSPIEQNRILTNEKYYPQFANILEKKVDKIRLTNEQFNNLAFQLNSGSITMKEAVLELRGGDGLIDVVVVLAFIIFVNLYDSFFGAEAFQLIPLPHPNPFGWLNGKYDSRNVGSSGSKPMTLLKMEKPTSMPQQEYSGISKSEKRQLADPLGRDRSINIDGFPQLDVRFNQVYFKTPKHGKEHGLPVGHNGKTPKTEANAIALRDSLVDMPNRENIIWYTDGQYQGGTARGDDSVNLFDPDTKVIAVYQKQLDGSYLFLTTCTLGDREIDHLASTNGNFVSEEILKQQNWRSEDRGVTPISPMDENSSPGFTPRSSFKSDVMGITPRDNSQFNNP